MRHRRTASGPRGLAYAGNGESMNRRLLVGLTVLAATAILAVATTTSVALHVSGDGETATPVDRMVDATLEAAHAASQAATTRDGPAPRIAYGMNGFYAGDVAERSDVDLDYGQVWVGSWVARPGRLADFESRVAQVKDEGLVPVVEWWYFGDQISVRAVTTGLPDGRNLARWHDLGPKVAKAACDGADGKLVFVVETEFNKGGVAGREAFDGELAKHVKAVKAACPTATVAIGFGLWSMHDWHRFDRAAAAADAVGFQLMRSLAKDTRAEYREAPALAVEGARKIEDLFGKPILLHDVALSSFGTDGRKLQAETLDALLDRRDALADAGVTLLLYRSVRDTPSMAKNNYYGAGEAHWGLWTTTGVEKPAYAVWVAGLRVAI